MWKFVLAFAASVAVATTLPALKAQIVRPWSFTAAERVAGEKLFQDHCGACHGRAGVASGYAPSLIDVIGRRAGSAPGFPYSPALKASGIVWSEDNLTKWIANAPALVPGTQMPHVSISDPAERLYVFEYLKSLSQRSTSGK